MSNVVEVRIQKQKIGIKFPHDKVYFFTREDRSLIPKIFRFALVMPVTEDFLSALKQLPPRCISTHKFLRDDKEKKKPTHLTANTATKNKEWWNDLITEYDLINRVAVVPILTINKANKLKPQYLTAKQWFKRQGERFNDEKKKIRKRTARRRPPSATKRSRIFKPAVSELSYLSTPYEEPHNIIQPICSICPMAFKHLSGECTPGQKLCYENLNFSPTGAKEVTE